MAVPICLTTDSSSGTPFNCDYNAYLFQADDIYAVDLAAGNAVLVAENFIGTNVNAAAYNPKDGYIWASVTSPSKTIIRIGKDYATDSFTISQLGTANRYIGAINSDGVYFSKGSGDTFYKIDLDPGSNSYTQFLASQNLSQSINIHDWAFNAVDNQLYTVEKGTNILYRINPQTAVVESLGEVPALSGLNYTYGAVYFDVEGRFYVSSNQSGTIYVIQNVQNLTGSNAIASNFFAFGPSSNLNDGARCPTAPVPQENCTNGIDDDSDGLVDCDDPVCSGVSSCPEMDEPTSGGDDGGVESNNRLSEVINRRNYQRIRTNHKFDFKKMPKRLKSMSYGRSKTSYSLSDFIPIAALGEDYSVESSPSDLIGITNATAVYAVDYIRENKTVASILSLETDSGVYEHTKYICDRLLGAEILSVATIEIQGQNFIRTILKNAEGNLEFAIGFSVRNNEDTTAMVVESHWNLDKYQSDKGFYNFQIWTNSIDDLILLSEEVLRLIAVQKPIAAYVLSSPPPIYVKKGFYEKGALQLQIVNTNSSDNVILEGGKRLTETSSVSNISQALSLNNYINKVTVETGSLFDFGFRIGDGVQTPDDLFLSDGPWGYDDAAISTSVSSFSVSQNTSLFPSDVLGIERNVTLTANTAEYISLYRALSPRYQPYDLSGYNSIRFDAKGSGNLELRLIKKNIDTWENQFVTQVKLTEDMQTYTIPFSDFNSSFYNDLQVEDIITVVFTMTSERGELTDKILTLEQLQFLNLSSLGTNNLSLKKNGLLLFPNPMVSESNLVFNLPNPQDNIQLKVFDQLGKLVQEYSHDGMEGENTIRLQKEQLIPGIYFGKLSKENGEVLGFVKILVQ
ncbi:hypothetical protein BSU00_11210 [Tenacibaculum sp. SG-28]|nr:hypothetical protein BSU00_11210 [Tenacibaculum sp. SG-28]